MGWWGLRASKCRRAATTATQRQSVTHYATHNKDTKCFVAQRAGRDRGEHETMGETNTWGHKHANRHEGDEPNARNDGAMRPGGAETEDATRTTVMIMLERTKGTQ